MKVENTTPMASLGQVENTTPMGSLGHVLIAAIDAAV
jgi:hypothetical protein